MKDTIAAISTSLGVGAISIIRVSGDNSIEIVAIFKDSPADKAGLKPGDKIIKVKFEKENSLLY